LQFLQGKNKLKTFQITGNGLFPGIIPEWEFLVAYRVDCIEGVCKLNLFSKQTVLYKIPSIWNNYIRCTNHEISWYYHFPYF